MRTPSLFMRLLLPCLLACGLAPACASDEPEPEPDDVEIADYAVRSADGVTLVEVCHVQSETPIAIAIAFSAVRSHLAHGDFLGPCEPPPGP
jgi:hypothetical protein